MTPVPTIKCDKPELDAVVWSVCDDNACLDRSSAANLLVYLKAVDRYFEECT